MLAFLQIYEPYYLLISFSCAADRDTAFVDTDAFATGQAVFIEEAQRQAKLVSAPYEKKWPNSVISISIAKMI